MTHKTDGVFGNERAVEQINGREGETATFLSRNLLNFSLRGSGFAPRHLNRWAVSLKLEHHLF